MSEEEYQTKRTLFFEEYWKALKSKNWVEVDKNESRHDSMQSVPDYPCRFDPTVTKKEYEEAWNKVRPKW